MTWDYSGNGIQHIREVASDHGQGIFAGTNDVVSRIGKVAGTTVGQFVKANQSAFLRAPDLSAL